MTEGFEIKQLRSGVPGLDEVLGGGLPEFSFNLIAGPPGSGKTTLAHQIMFASASPARPALYISILGEPSLKMLRYQQQFAFFDANKIPGCIRFLHLGAELLEGGLEKVLESIVEEVEGTTPKLVFVDSFRSLVEKGTGPGQLDLAGFVQRLSLHLTTWEATTFLIGEYEEREAQSNPLFTVADGILWLSQVTDRNSIVRKAQVVKMRGQGQIPGLHTMKMSKAGLRLYPRLSQLDEEPRAPRGPRASRRTGIEGLDRMLGGGIPSGYSVLVVGPSGSGKTILSSQFIREGIKHGERGVIAVFEKRPEEYLTTAPGTKVLGELVEEGKLRIIYLRPLDLSVDETMEAITDAVRAIDAKRIVIDSLSGFELALAPSFREDFRESLYRMMVALTGLGVTVMMTCELAESFTELRFSPHGISFLTDGIILQRYVEIAGHLRKVLTVVKMRGIEHTTELRRYDISPEGIAMGEALTNYEGLLSGAARLIATPDDGGR